MTIKGSRRPAHKLVPPARDRSAGREAIELVRSVGIDLDEWQKDILLASMGRDRAGHWVADDVVVIVPRQCGKTVALLARELWGAVYGEERLQLHTAHQQRTSYEAFLELVSWCETDALAPYSPKINRGRGNEAVTIASNRIVFISRSRTSGRGFSPSTVVIDESFELSDVAMEALVPSMSAQARPQAWFASSAPHPTSTVLRRLAVAGRAGELERATYLEWCGGGGDPSSPRTWAKANPALGTRLTERFTRTEMEALDPEGFARERLGIWHEDETSLLFPPGSWAALADPNARASGDKAIAVDVSPDRRRSVIAAAGELAERGFTRDQAGAALSRQDFPWGELEAELARGEALDKIAQQYGMTIEQVTEIRRQLQNPDPS